MKKAGVFQRLAQGRKENRFIPLFVTQWHLPQLVSRKCIYSDEKIRTRRAQVKSYESLTGFVAAYGLIWLSGV